MSISNQISDRTPIHLTIKVFLVTLGATFGLASALFTMRDTVLKDVQITVQQTVRQAVAEETAARQEQARHFITREEWLQQTSQFQIRFEQRMGELRELILEQHQRCSSGQPTRSSC